MFETRMIFSTLLMMGFLGVPKNIKDTALLGGRNRTQVLTKIVFPLIIPGVIAVSICIFLNS